jgi:hypothetical protein
MGMFDVDARGPVCAMFSLSPGCLPILIPALMPYPAVAGVTDKFGFKGLRGVRVGTRTDICPEPDSEYCGAGSLVRTSGVMGTGPLSIYC